MRRVQCFKATTLRSGVLLVLSLLALQPADAAYTMNETCQYMGNGYIGNPSNCQGWGLCQSGVLVGTGLCNTGFLYDMAAGICNYASSVTCRTTVTNICASLTTPQLIMNPENCNAYCYCSKSISPDCGNCPKNQIFDPNTQACIWNTKDACSADSICRLVPNNKFVSNPNQCGAYLRCEAGAGISGTCTTSGYGYNQLTGYCESGFVCNGNDVGVEGDLPSNPTACKSTTATAAAPVYISDGTTCFGYYTCTTTTGPGSWSKCPFGTHYNPAAGTGGTGGACVTPYTYACPYNRCGNLNLPFVNAVNTGCTQYTVCYNQSAGSSQKCSTVNPSYPYFDEYAGSCSITNPAYAVCSSTS